MSADNINRPDLCEARVNDPEWQAEQQAKNDAAVARFATWRAENDLPLVRKAKGTVD